MIFFSYPTFFSSAPTLDINNDWSLIEVLVRVGDICWKGDNDSNGCSGCERFGEVVVVQGVVDIGCERNGFKSHHRVQVFRLKLSFVKS